MSFLLTHSQFDGAPFLLKGFWRKIMDIRHYEYRIVNSGDCAVAEIHINKLAVEGFRVISSVAAAGERKTWMWTLEREILPERPYR
jgi:hypothetical protein